MLTRDVPIIAYIGCRYAYFYHIGNWYNIPTEADINTDYNLYAKLIFI